MRKQLSESPPAPPTLADRCREKSPYKSECPLFPNAGQVCGERSTPSIELASDTDPAVSGLDGVGLPRRGKARVAGDSQSRARAVARHPVEHPKDRFDSQLETLKEGKHLPPDSDSESERPSGVNHTEKSDKVTTS